MLFGEDLILFEANARRVRALPLVSGDPLDATGELGKLIVKKINQLGACVGALLAGEAELPGVDLARVKRIWPIAVAGGHVWQTRTLWTYLDETRDAAKCSSFTDPRVQPLQLLDADTLAGVEIVLRTATPEASRSSSPRLSTPRSSKSTPPLRTSR